MKILLFTLNYAPEVTGIGKYSTELAEWLFAQGHEVRVITASPYYPQWRVLNGYQPSRYKIENINGVRVTRVPFWCPRRVSGVSRVLHLASFAAGALPAALANVRWKPEAVWVVEPPLFASPIALLTAKLSKASSYLHIQDYELDAAFELGVLDGRFLRRIGVRVERFLMSRFDKISTISVKMLERAKDKGVPSERSILFPNWVNTSEIFPLFVPSAYRRELDIEPGAIVVLYSGNMGQKQGLELLPKVAKKLRDWPDLLFVFCGSGPGRRGLQEACRELSNIRFIDLQPNDKFNDLLSLADIHILPQRSDAADLVMPSKLLGMLASGRPIIATAHRNTELWQTIHRIGIVVDPGSVEELCAGIVKLANDRGLREELGAAGRAYAISERSKDAVLSRYEEVLINTASEKRRSKPLSCSR
ncbi:glycosyl transferase [Caballeronia arvi]|uniref:Glycosyl transferase n=1 Tax=Caballeronia arvi TaxID=1777135 RepID=A0A158KZM3_9BURK|nr:glycosyltransferase WbuB [Caballeronia arvi]SAL86435.1 glycosyl transferase [Caballeronia arvi]